MALGRSTLHLQLQSMSCWSSGIVKETKTMVTFLATQCCKAANSFGGIATSVQKARYTAGRLTHTAELLARRYQDALAVLGRICVSALLSKMFVLMLQLTLTLTRMVSVLLE